MVEPDCCTDCGNYNYRSDRMYPCRIQCWKNVSGHCHCNPNKATVAQMKTRAIFVRNPTPGEDCSICFNPMNGRYVKKIFCGHTFHSTCLSKWEERKRTCPMCRFNYENTDDVGIFNRSFAVWRDNGHTDDDFDTLGDAYDSIELHQMTYTVVVRFTMAVLHHYSPVDHSASH